MKKTTLLLITFLFSIQIFAQKIEDLPRATSSKGTDLIILDQETETRGIAKYDLYDGDTLFLAGDSIFITSINGILQINGNINIDNNVTINDTLKMQKTNQQIIGLLSNDIDFYANYSLDMVRLSEDITSTTYVEHSEFLFTLDSNEYSGYDGVRFVPFNYKVTNYEDVKSYAGLVFAPNNYGNIRDFQQGIKTTLYNKNDGDSIYIKTAIASLNTLYNFVANDGIVNIPNAIVIKAKAFDVGTGIVYHENLTGVDIELTGIAADVTNAIGLKITGNIEATTQYGIYEDYGDNLFTNKITTLDTIETPVLTLANTLLIFDDGDTSRIEFENPLKIGNGFTFESNGTLKANTANYETLVTSNNDIPNKKYIDDATATSPTTLEYLFIEDQTVVALTNNQIVPWGTSPSILTGGTFTSNQYTVGQDGRFEVISIISVLNTSGQSDDTFDFHIRKNTTSVAYQTVDPMAYAGENEEAPISVTGIIDCIEGDIIDLYITGISDAQDYQTRQLSIKQLPSTMGLAVSGVNITNQSTGLIKGGIISVNSGDNTLIDISAGFGQIVNSTTDPDNPTKTPVPWIVKTGYDLTTMPAPGDVVAIFLSIDSNGDVIEGLALPTPDERRDYISLGIVARIDNGIIVFAGNDPKNIIHNPTSQLQDFMEAWGSFNLEGNQILPNATDLQIKKTEGSVFSNGSNFVTNPKNPHVKILAEQAPVDPFNYKLGDGTDITLVASELDPDNYDDGTDILATVPINKWTVQHVSVFSSNVVEVLYGQEVFDKEEDAITALANIEFIIPSDSKGAIPLSYIVLQQGDISIPDDRFYRIRFKGGSGGSVNYWTRTGTEIAPRIAGDDIVLATQTELAPYPNFSADPNWTIFSGDNTWIYDDINDRMRPTGELTGNTIANTGIALTNGKTYVISLSWSKSAGSCQIYQGSGGTQISDYIDDGTLSRKWIFIASADENLFVRTTSAFHDDETTDYISEFSVIEIDNMGNISTDRLALGGLKPEYYSQLDNYSDMSLFFSANKGIFTTDEFIIRNINSGGLDFDEIYARPMLSSYSTSLVFGSNGYDITGIRADSSINLRTYAAGKAITINESSLDTDFILNGSGVEAYKYDAGDAIHSFNGNLGIGTTDPNAPLEVVGPTGGTVGGWPSGMIHIRGNGTAEFSNAVITGHNSYNGNTQLWYLGSTSGSNNNIAFINRENADLSFWTNGDEKMTLESDGALNIKQNPLVIELTAGEDLEVGDVVKIGSADLTVIKTIVSEEEAILGVVETAALNGNTVKISRGGILIIKITGTVTRGDFLATSTVAGTAISTGTGGGQGDFAVALESGTDGTIRAVYTKTEVF